MRPSQKQRLYILDYLSSTKDGVNMNTLKKLLDSASKKGYSDTETFNIIASMGRDQDDLLTIQIVKNVDGGGTMVVHENYWLTPKGKDYIYDLQHSEPEEAYDLMPDENDINNTSNDQQTKGRNSAMYSRQDSERINNSIHQILQLKEQLPDRDDKIQLEELSALLRKLLSGEEQPKTGLLRKYHGFLDRTHKITSPVVSPIIVEAFSPLIF